ncbi:MAG: signal recognition particle-docking protein FtsY [Armatimonadetes bacterium]|nr:signal recognition particle-docking protein FtsY [Armatimonadota bacterium]MDW8121532.1 signal recognition particle-docking protein FtsY [Armatimonadota bacterium]
MRLFSGLVERFARIFRSEKVDESVLDELEEALLAADAGLSVTDRLLEGIREGIRKKRFRSSKEVQDALINQIVEILPPAAPFKDQSVPSVWLFLGINGTGKTTTIAKIARWLQKRRKKPYLVAADTFRAAGIEQLKIWGDRLGAPVLCPQRGSDPAAVAFDGIQAAKAQGYDFVLIDTAGRMHTSHNLLQEMAKIYRSTQKALGREPDEILLILDGTAGQNGLSQVRRFHSVVPLTGLIVTKLDGTAKGGIVLAIAAELGLPIKAVGVGEGVDDLEPFDPQAFARSLLGADGGR